jgi:hypothetical protein
MAPPKKKRGFWRTLRIYFRRFRITVWILVLLVLGSVIYVNQIGLPGFIKDPLLEKLRQRGIDLRFVRLRVRWYQGVVAENVRFGRSDEPFGPTFGLEQVQVHLNHHALLRFKLQVDSLSLRKGKLIWPVYATNAAIGSAGSAQTNEPAKELKLENVQTDLRLLPGDEWSLDDFTATFAGAKLHLSGSITNASSIRDWTFLQGRKHAPLEAGLWQRRLDRLAHTLDQIHFPAPPDLVLNVRGDGHDPQSFFVRVMVNTPAAETPWGNIEQGKCVLRLYPRNTNEPTHAELKLEATQANTPWADATNVDLALHLFALGGEPNLFKATLHVSAKAAQTKWGGVSDARLEAESFHTLTNPIPISGHALLTCSNPTSQWAAASSARLSVAMATQPLERLAAPDPALGFWENLRPYKLGFECAFTNVQHPKLSVETLQASGTWDVPKLSITKLTAQLYDGSLETAADLDVLTRMVSSRVRADFDMHQAEGVLTEGGRKWLSNYVWKAPPKVIAGLNVTLPAWTNRQPDWRKEVQPTLLLDGEFDAAQGGAYQQIPISRARSHFTYSNMTWCLPDLLATRPEGEARIFLNASDLTKRFYFHVHSSIDPMVARQLLETNVQRGFDFVSLSQPPVLDAELWGRWHHHEELGAKAKIAGTNFSVRGQHIDGLQADLFYTNKTLLVTGAHAQRGRENASADLLFADFPNQKLYVTNGFSTFDPMVIVRCIGPHVTKVIEPYHFDLPPAGRVNGIIPLRHEKDADLHFEVIGGPFHWWKFNIPQIAGNIDWVGEQLSLGNIRCDFYGGHATGHAFFDFASHDGADYRFAFSVTNALLEKMMIDLAPRTNALEGLLSGDLVVTRASTRRTNDIEGYGKLQLKEGLIWAIPMFGAFSPVLDNVNPGLGSSRASSGVGNFTITNGIIHSDDLEIRSPAMRLQYRGAVSLDGKVNARVDAVLLRDMWVLGPLVSTVFWPFTKLFEYHVTGSLAKPKLEPVYIVPRIITAPFHPFRSIKDMMPEEPPPAAPPPPKQ